MKKYQIIAPELRRIGATSGIVGASVAQPDVPYFWLGADAENISNNNGLGGPRFDRDCWQALADPLGEALAKAGAIDVVM